MNDKKLKEIKQKYKDIPIPDELDFIVKKSIKDGGKKYMKRKNRFRWIALIAGMTTIFTIGINSSVTIANALSEVPIINGLVKVLTFREYSIDEEGFNADIKVPAVEGLENKDLEESLNEKYIEENKKLYEEFTDEMEKMKEKNSKNLGVSSGYEVKTDNEKIISIARYVVMTAGSSYEQIKYDTIDKENEILLTLPSLFKDDSYIDVISENIKTQMEKAMKSDTGKVYFIEEDDMDPFNKIDKEQSFYINNDGKLVISFNEYEVAPGYMGVVEFVIPTNVISDILVSDEYIK
ncbi:DUF3298 and DUF4163 domain-containing protein [Clostridiisalibacter paucivorans]|uniref:DUF3298 and DUF4163 domain-containing protein n=1 Tax=Clostridiisalibacter paucivorans TaxID=408753 RepID=UPI00047C0CF4|nr:DUF3298 and DUF4163 domain-containing protein [Clostridiisalibacter paucivorans]